MGSNSSTLSINTKPVQRRRFGVEVDVLEFGELIQPGPRQFAADAAGLVATPRRLWKRRVVVIDPNGADPQAFSHAVSLADVLGPDPGGQTIRCVIGQS